MDGCGDIFSFRMHDLMHGLAMQVAADNGCCCLDGKAKKVLGRLMRMYAWELIMLKQLVGWSHWTQAGIKL